LRKRSRAESAVKQGKDIQKNGKWARDRVSATMRANLAILNDQVSLDQTRDTLKVKREEYN
jgi:hypothetical protein